MRTRLLKKLRKRFAKSYIIVQTTDKSYPIKVLKGATIPHAYFTIESAKQGIAERIEDDIRYYIECKRGRIKIIE